MSLDTNLLDGPYATVFDVGAYVGDFARACLIAWPACRIVSFEPLADRTGPPDRRWTWIPVALGEARETRLIHRCKFVPSSSLLPMADLHRQAFPYTDGERAVSVPVRTVKNYAGLASPPALLKIDVQGYELGVLRGAGETLRCFRAVVLEVSHEELYHGAPTPDDLAGFLTDAGFLHSRRIGEMAHPDDGRLLQSDELWRRP